MAACSAASGISGMSAEMFFFRTFFSPERPGKAGSSSAAFLSV
jgi:hypothetical protein